MANDYAASDPYTQLHSCLMMWAAVVCLLNKNAWIRCKYKNTCINHWLVERQKISPSSFERDRFRLWKGVLTCICLEAFKFKLPTVRMYHDGRALGKQYWQLRQAFGNSVILPLHTKLPPPTPATASLQSLCWTIPVLQCPRWNCVRLSTLTSNGNISLTLVPC